VKLKAREPLEQDIKNAILAWLFMQKNCYVWPNDSTGIFDPVKKIYRKKHSKYHRIGISDILGIWNGRPLAIEVKRPKGVVSPEQRVFLNEFNKHGGIGFIARSVDDVIEHLKSSWMIQSPSIKID